ncbi:MAG: TolC family protein [Bacteroidales bacterium]|nr:TolC family protein [Bacteroidales bacterium]
MSMSWRFLVGSVLMIFAVCMRVQAQSEVQVRGVQQQGERVELTLQQVFQIAEESNRSVKSADVVAMQAEQAVSVAKSGRLPQLSAEVSFLYYGDGKIMDRNFSDAITAPMPHYGNNLVVEASQLIYGGGVVATGVEMAERGYAMAQSARANVLINLKFMLASNYLELFKLKNLEQIYIKNIEQTERLVQDIKERSAEGVALKNDVTRYELQLQSFNLALTQVRNGQKIINNNLVTELQLPEGSVIVIDTNLISTMPAVLDESEWIRVASEASPIIELAKLEVEQALGNEKIIKSERLPKVALIAQEHLDGPITIEVPPIDKNFNYWFAGVGVSYNFASLYTSNKKSAEAKLATRKAEEERLKAQDDIQMGVKSAYVKFTEAFTIYETSLKSLELASQNYDVVNYRYLNDLALITDMLDATNSKLSAELECVNAKINILFNFYALQRVAGVL